MEAARGENCLSGQRRVKSHPGRIRSNPWIKIIPYLNNKPGLRTKTTVIPGVEPAPHGVATPSQGKLLLIGVRVDHTQWVQGVEQVH